MQDLIDFLARKEISIVVIILVAAIVLYFILWFVSLIKKHEMKKKLKNNTLELKAFADQIKLEEKKQKKKKQEVMPVVANPKKVEIIEPILPKIEEAKKENTAVDQMILKKDEEIELLEEEPIQYKEEVYTKEEAKEELNRITETLRKEQEKPKVEMKPFVKEEKVVEVKEEKKEERKQEVVEEKKGEKDNIIPLTSFEEEEEHHAIISLEELLEKGKTITQEEIVKYEDEGNEPITIEELEARYKEEKKQEEKIEAPKKTVEQPKKKEVELVEFYKPKVKPYQAANHYRPTPVISPIFGIEEQHIAREKAIELENTATYEKFDKEILRTSQFVAKLKELQSVLQKESD